MAKKPQPASDIDLSGVEDDAVYQVKLKRNVNRPHGIILKPSQATRVSGAVLKQIGADVDGFEPV